MLLCRITLLHPDLFHKTCTIGNNKDYDSSENMNKKNINKFQVVTILVADSVSMMFVATFVCACVVALFVFALSLSQWLIHINHA